MNAEEITREVFSGLRRILRAIELHSRRLMQNYGLTGPQLYILKSLGDTRQEISVGQIALEVSLSSATVTDIIVRLEKRGLVQRTRSTVDKRKVLVRATADGARLLATAPPLFREQFIEKFRDLEPWERTFILSALQRLVAMMEAEGLDVPSAAAADPITTLSEATAPFLSKGISEADDDALPEVFEARKDTD